MGHLPMGMDPFAYGAGSIEWDATHLFISSTQDPMPSHGIYDKMGRDQMTNERPDVIQ